MSILHLCIIFKVKDAVGKTPPGQLLLNTKWIGFYDECVDAVAIKNGIELFRGGYCWVYADVRFF